MSAASARTGVRRETLIETARPCRSGRDATPRAGTSLTRSVSDTQYGDFLSQGWLSVTLTIMVGTLLGYARCSTDEQDLTAQRQRLAELGVDKSPSIGNLQLIPALFLLVGLAGTYGSLWAMAAIWSNADMRFGDDILGGNAEAHNHITEDEYRALVVITWALWFLTVPYIAQLFTTAF